MPVTVDDVKRVYAEEIGRGKTSVEARQGTRTVIMGRLAAESPPPHSDRPTDLVGIEDRRYAAGEKPMLTLDERARIKAHQIAQISDADIVSSERARSSVDGTHRDAHHFKQKEHQKKQWEQTDILVAAALGSAS